MSILQRLQSGMHDNLQITKAKRFYKVRELDKAIHLEQRVWEKLHYFYGGRESSDAWAQIQIDAENRSPPYIKNWDAICVETLIALSKALYGIK